jgi:hypothetical protein
MDRNKVGMFFSTIMLIAGLWPGASKSTDAGQMGAQTIATLSLLLRAASGATIEFKTQNGVMVDGILPEARDVPHLVLRRNGELTDPDERTLIVEVASIEVPPTGVTVTLTVETQRGDADIVGDSPPRIQVWHESRSLPNGTGATERGVTIVLRHEFTATVWSSAEEIATTTDYFRYDLVVTDALHPAGSPIYTFSQDYAFLLENQWTVSLPAVREAAPGAAPDELVVYYCDPGECREMS